MLYMADCYTQIYKPNPLYTLIHKGGTTAYFNFASGHARQQADILGPLSVFQADPIRPSSVLYGEAGVNRHLADQMAVGCKRTDGPFTSDYPYRRAGCV